MNFPQIKATSVKLLIIIIILIISSTLLGNGLEERSQNPNVSHLSDDIFRNFSRSMQISENSRNWGAEDGWSASEHILLREIGNIIYGLYSEDGYIAYKTGTRIGQNFYSEFMPNGWFKTLEGKSLTVSSWIAPSSSNEQLETAYDSLYFEEKSITGNVKWMESSTELDIQFNNNGTVDSIVTTSNLVQDFDRLIYENVNGVLVKKTHILDDTIRYWMDLTYDEEGHLSKIVENNYNGRGKLAPDRMKIYTFHNGLCGEIKEYYTVGKSPLTELFRWKLTYNENNALTSAARRRVDTDGSLYLGSALDSFLITYTESGKVKTRENFRSISQGINKRYIYNWSPTTKDSTVYDHNGNPVEEFDYKWNKTDLQWTLDDRYGYSFYEYDSQNNLIRYSKDSSEPDNVITYVNGFPSSVIQKDENDSLYSSVYFELIERSTSINNVPRTSDVNISISNGIVSLQNVSTVSSLKLFTLSGREVTELYSSTVNGSVTFNLHASGVAKGVYIGIVTADNAVQEIKLSL